MKTKKQSLSMVLAVIMLIALCACGGTTSGGNTGGGTTGGGSAPASSGEVYTLSLSINDPQGSLLDEHFVTPLQDLLDQKTGNRIKLDVYYSNSLSGMGNTLDGVKSGLVDIGYDVLTFYPGTYPYTELYGTPGLNLGGFEGFSRVLQDYAKAFPEPALDPFVIIARFAFGDFGILTANKPVTTIDDVKGMTVRTTTNFIPWYESMGVSCVTLPMGEVYESLRLSVIDGVHTSVGSLQAFRLAEISSYYTLFTMCCGDSVFAMSRDLYNSMDAELQKAIDEICVEMFEIGIQFAYTSTEVTMNFCKEINPDFEFLQVADTAPFVEAAQTELLRKAAELDAAGHDGTGALEWLRARAVK